MSDQAQTAPQSERDGLREVAVETERYVARDGWDQSARLFALVPTSELAGSAPGLSFRTAGPDDLSAVEQEGFEERGDVQQALGRIAWPQAVLGVALAVERLVVPPAAERDLPDDPTAALQRLQDHPDRRDVRLLAAGHRDGRRLCLLRQRAHDSDDLVATGPDLAPGLLAALAATLQEDLPR